MRKQHAFQQSTVQLLLIGFDYEPIKLERPRIEPAAPYVDKTVRCDFASECGEFMSANDDKEELYRSLRESYFRP